METDFNVGTDDNVRTDENVGTDDPCPFHGLYNYL